MAFDQATGQMVLFGGATGPFRSFATDTWTWDGVRWSRAPLGSGPIGRSEPALAYDPVRHLVLMRGGLSGDNKFIDENWTWNGSRWLITNPTLAPPTFVGGDEPLVWDSSRNTIVLFAYTRYELNPYDIPELSQTWTWDGTNWSQFETSGAPSGYERSPSRMVFDSARKTIAFVGLVAGTPIMWTLQGSIWSKVSTVGTASESFVIAADEARSEVVLLGKNGDTWTWDGTRWTPQNPVHSPPHRVGEAIAYDSKHQVVVVFGGSSTESSNWLNDTWTWNGSDWTQVA
jgi:hypothetical protein